MGPMLDPVLAKHLSRAGIDTRAAYVSDVSASTLDGFHVVVILRGPIPGHPVNDMEAWRALLPGLHHFVERGGGLMVMDTECYGKTVAPLNELLEPWNLKLYFNDLQSPSSRTGFFPRFVEGRVLPFSAPADSPVKVPGGVLDVLVEGGHGAQHLTCHPLPGPVCWRTVLQGGPEVISRYYRDSYVNSSEKDWSAPIGCAVAEVGRGRVAAFPGAAPFWIVNPYIWRFEGRLLEQRDGAGRLFLIHLISWLADTPRNKTLSPARVWRGRETVTPDGLIKPEQFSFRTVTPAEQKQWLSARPRKVWIGPGRLDARLLKTRVAACLRDGYAAVMPMAEYSAMNESSWKRAVRQALDFNIPVWPGLHLIDGEGMRTASYTTGPWPKLHRQYPNSTLLEAVWLPHQGSAAMLRTPLQNRLPPQRYGGFNLLEWEPGPDWFALYARLLASKQFMSPVAVRADDDAPGPDTWVLNPRRASPLDGLRGSRHHTFVSDGPRVLQFAFEGGEWIDDEWEGFWLALRPGQRIAVRITLEADAPLREVTLWDGEEVLARFTPSQRRWSKVVRFTTWRDRSLHLTAEDADGGRLHATYPLYTRISAFWGHVGGDNMNNYVNALQPARHGFLGVGQRNWEPFGFVTLGQGWGDYLRIAPALPYADFMPRQEISFTLGSFREHHPSAWLRMADGQVRYLNDHRRVFGFCGADGQHYIDRIAGEQKDNVEGATQMYHHRKVRPTRILREVPEVSCRDEYYVWRWAPYQPIGVEVEKVFRFAPGVGIDRDIVVGSNTHQTLPGLYIGDIENTAHRLCADALPESPPIESHKEWDNSHYVRQFTPGDGAVFEPGPSGAWEVGHGGVGTLAFIPLGAPRPWSLRLLRTARECMIFIHTKINAQEMAAGECRIRYLLAVDATEGEPLPFADMVQTIGRNQGQWSVTLDLGDQPFPCTCALPASGGRRKTMRLILRGLPSGTYTARDPKGRRCFVAQPVRGCSMHILHGPIPRSITLTRQDTLKGIPA